MTDRTRPHVAGDRFRNPTGQNGRPQADVPRMLAERRAAWPSTVPVTPRDVQARHSGAWAAVTFVGHSTFVVQTPSGTLITDPMFSERASPVSFAGPRRVRQPGVPLARLPRIDLVLLSHNHYDHCDLPSLRALARRDDPVLLTPLGNARLARAAGFRHVEELDWWQRATLGSLPVTAAPAQHFSARTPWDRNRALWGSFVVEVSGRRLYFAGDSGYAPHFHEVRRRLGDIDLALLPIGAYEPRWFMQHIHMNPEEAVLAHRDLGAALSVGMHFGTFRLTTEAIDAPLEALDAARARHAVPHDRFITLEFGETRQVAAGAAPPLPGADR